MSTLPADGQEDDDFAYEDEHIEMESDNQEYDDLEESEFDRRSVPVRAAADAVPSVAPASAVLPPPQPAPQPSPDEHPALPFGSRRKRAVVLPPRKLSGTEGRKKRTAKAAKPPSKAPRKLDTKKLGAPARVTKRTQAVRNTGAKLKKKNAVEKTASRKKSSTVKKKATAKALPKGKRSQPTQRKKRRG